ncbi:hypothetical protein [Dyadobacter sp. LHD-138]|uniref:hypothetical protein n=1 Tax=Dyadobacter sp. LHD-138 TaxID=3071413 RepID=UPI0027E03E92|nr:hypothetical protein [Dyadobacter sp. LHD-138]MDQ6482570.1 hypothetical protein [Dyadobacter sp. LHD-138]
MNNQAKTRSKNQCNISNQILKSLSVTLLFFTLFYISSGCSHQDRQQELTALQRENQSLKNRLKQERTSLTNTLETPSSNLPRKYGYVVLYIEQREGYPPEIVKSKHLSKIHSIYEEVNPDIASRLLDLEQESYLSSINAKINHAKVIQRILMHFDTYAEASTERAREMAE